MAYSSITPGTPRAAQLQRAQALRVELFLHVAGAVLPRHLKPDCCIAFGRIARRVLGDHLGLRTRVLTTTACAMTQSLADKGRWPASVEEGQRWQEEGCYSVVLGHPDDARPDDRQQGRWAGHLVAIVGEVLLLDLTITQASRPGRGLSLAPVLAAVSPAFLSGEVALELSDGNCLLAYEARPEDVSYQEAPDWFTPGRFDAIEAEILANIRRALKNKE